ncbi:MAG: hypothetical protein RSE94_03000, partial [Pseudomonas sp.]
RHEDGQQLFEVALEQVLLQSLKHSAANNGYCAYVWVRKIVEFTLNFFHVALNVREVGSARLLVKAVKTQCTDFR